MSGPGHNSAEAVAVDRLRSHVARIERLNEERAALAADVKEIYTIAKAEGFDVKVLRLLIARRKKDRAELQEQDAMLELYESGMGEDAP